MSLKSGLLAAFGLLVSSLAGAAPPILYHTPHFESPVQGGPDDLVFLGGLGFHGNDRVVYESRVNMARYAGHPVTVPTRSTRELGTASVVKLGAPPYSLTIRLPEMFDATQVYRLWVVNAAGEWSEPISLNDPRPLWVSPAYVYETVDLAELQRRIRVVGRNLDKVLVRLQGPQTYTLGTAEPKDGKMALSAYVAEALLPSRVAPGSYKISVSREGSLWTDVPDQRLAVLADPPLPRIFDISDPRFGSCRPDDERDDSPCLSKAIAAAQQAGGGTIEFSKGRWDLHPAPRHEEAEFVLPLNVNLKGAGADGTTLVWRVSESDQQQALLLVEGSNSITGFKFVDERRFSSFDNSRPVVRLGHRWDDPRVQDGKVPDTVRNVVISKNLFRRVGIAVMDGGLPIERLFVTHNDFGGYARGLELPGVSHSLRTLYRIDDSVIRWNRFVPGSYVDISLGQGVIATGLGASRRVDFSSNNADGASSEGLQDPGDPRGWRAAFFWNMFDSGEMLLLAENRITCPGDKAGDGEAIAFDGNGDTFGYAQAETVTRSTPGSVTVSGELQSYTTRWAAGADTYYVGHWVQVVAGPGLGQTRRIRLYHTGPGRQAVFQITPAWDVAPVAGQSKVVVARQFWQTYVVGNEINQSAPVCAKANLNGPKGGEITMWAPSADSVIASNRQIETSGIGFTQGYSVKTASCPTCDNHSAVQTALQIRGNQLLGEYDWTSDCSRSGIHGTFGASPTPEAPPPTVSFGVQVEHNLIEHADGLGGGAIEIVPTWHTGPEPHRWDMINNLVISHNEIRDVEGPVPRKVCGYAQRGRIGIRIEGAGDVIGTVLYKNSCQRTGVVLADSGTDTTRVCDASVADSCECGPEAVQPNTSK